MTAASEHSWMDDVIQGKDYSEVIAADQASRGFSASGLQHRETPVKSVVNEFLARKHLFSRDDLQGYINTALQNEAREMIADKTFAAELSGSWEAYAESLRSGQIPADSATLTVRDAETKAAAAAADFEAGYAQNRRLLAETVADLHETNEVAVTSETWSTLAHLNHDGHFSEYLGFDAQTALVAAIRAEQQMPVPVPETAAPAVRAASGIIAAGRVRPVSVDFSREAAPVPAPAAVRIRRAEPSQPVKTGAAGKETEEQSLPRRSTEPIQVGRLLVSAKFNAGCSPSSRKKLDKAMDDRLEAEPEAAEDTGPELT